MNKTATQQQINLLQEQIELLNLELNRLQVPPVPLKKVVVESLPNGFLLGIKTETETPYDERTELFLTKEEGKELVKELLLGCDDALFLVHPFSKDFSDMVQDIGRAFGL